MVTNKAVFEIQLEIQEKWTVLWEAADAWTARQHETLRFGYMCKVKSYDHTILGTSGLSEFTTQSPSPPRGLATAPAKSQSQGSQAFSAV